MIETLLGFLRQNAGVFYCASCLARASGVALRELRELWPGLVTHRAVQITDAPCVLCLEVRTVIRVKPEVRAAFPSAASSAS